MVVVPLDPSHMWALIVQASSVKKSCTCGGGCYCA